MATPAISVGIAECKIDGKSLGSCSNAFIDMTGVTVPIHSEKVGTAYIVPYKYAIKSINGVLSVTTEELSLAKDILVSMKKAMRGTQPETKTFSCTVPGSGGGISGSVILLPQFTISVSIDGWSSITFNLPIVTSLIADAGAAPTDKVGGIYFIDTSKNKGAVTVNKNNLCCAASYGTNKVATLELEVSSQYSSIFRSGSAWPTDHVLESSKIIGHIGFYDFTSATAAVSTEEVIDLIFTTIDGTNITYSLGDKCVKYLSGLRTSSNGVNTWLVRVEGNGF